MKLSRKFVSDYIDLDENLTITEIAEALPEHTVVPYRNIPKKYYPSNIPKEDTHATPSN